MEHTPTPWAVNEYADTSKLVWISELDMQTEIAESITTENAKRIVECVNACAEFPDPKIDIGLLKLHAEQQTKLLASCEAALAERDVTIQALQDRVKELEDNNPISQIFSFEKPKPKKS
jgi:flavoprotein